MMLEEVTLWFARAVIVSYIVAMAVLVVAYLREA